MAATLKNRVLEITSTAGLADFVLAGPGRGYAAFAGTVADGATVDYAAVHRTEDQWECGSGIFHAGTNSIARTTIESSSAAGAKVDFAAGDKQVMLTVLASKTVTREMIATTAAAGLMSAADKAALDGAAPLASPMLTGNPTAPTPSSGDADSSIATTAFVAGAVRAQVVPALQALLAMATDVVAVDVYGWWRDTDLGAWRGRGRGASWSLGAAGKRDFPAVVGIYGRSTGGVLAVHDLLDQDASGVPKVWRSWTVVGLTSVCATQGRVYYTASSGLYMIDLANDRVDRWTASGRQRANQSVATYSQSTATWTTVDAANPIVSADAARLAARVLPGAPLDQAGLPVPTVVVATPAGASIIHPSGLVADITTTLAPTDARVFFMSDSRLAFSRSGALAVGPIPYADAAEGSWRTHYHSGGTAGGTLRWGDFTSFAALTGNAFASPTSLRLLAEENGNPANGVVGQISAVFNTGWQPGDIRLAALCEGTTGAIVETILLDYDGSTTTGWTADNGASLSISSGRLQVTGASNYGTAYRDVTTVVGQAYTLKVDYEIGTSNAAIMKVDATSPYGGLVSVRKTATSGTEFITFVATSTTSRILVQFENAGTAYFDNISVKLSVADRSYKSKGLTVIGTGLTRTAVATGADIAALSGFGVTSYPEQPYNVDLDFLGDFSISFWHKTTDISTSTSCILERRDPANVNNPLILIQKTSAGLVQAIMRDTANYSATSVSTITSGTWVLITVIRRGSSLEVWINDSREASVSCGTGSLANAGAVLRLGREAGSAAAPNAGSIALLRIAAYAPTPAQIRKMHADERALFGAGARAFLVGISNDVRALAANSRKALLAVGTAGGGVSVFAGLQRVGAYTMATHPIAMGSNTVTALSYEGDWLTIGTSAGAGLVTDGDQYLRDRRDQVQASSPIRVHGVTTDATPTDLAPRLLLGERETMAVEARIVGRVHGATDGQRIAYLRRATVYRDAGGNVTLQGSVQTVGSDTEVTATADATLSLDTAAQTVAVRVTGVAATRIVWTADLTVTRISEDQVYG